MKIGLIDFDLRLYTAKNSLELPIRQVLAPSVSFGGIR